MEIWKDVKSYEGFYQVSNIGIVKSLGNNNSRKDKILKTTIDGSGYLKVDLYNKGIRKSFKVHKLVAIAFLNHTPCGMGLVVNHIDFNKLNNKADNLEIISQRENSNRKHIKSSSAYVGVYWNKIKNKWHSRIVINNKSIHLGLFANEIDAHNAYQNKLKSSN